MNNNYALAVHGGAGNESDNDEGVQIGMARAMESGKRILEDGGSALDAVITAVSILEDDPAFNAGRGSALNEKGEVEMDASVMEGRDLKAGSVAAVRNVKNPILLARMVMQEAKNVMLIGDGAVSFGKMHDIEIMSTDYFITDFRKRQLEKAKRAGESNQAEKFGTVGAVARDNKGNLAAATSTGGMVNKRFGRIGDTPIIGAGTYADNETCAVSATGHGEQLIRAVLSKTIADVIRYTGVSAQEAADSGLKYLIEKIKGTGGVIVVDKNGELGFAYSSPNFTYAILRSDGKIEYHL